MLSLYYMPIFYEAATQILRLGKNQIISIKSSDTYLISYNGSNLIIRYKYKHDEDARKVW